LPNRVRPRSRRPRPTSPSKRLLNDALPGSCATFSPFKLQSGHFTR
jgi:hypothetical protein